jgi:hypothetical protein
MRDMQSRQTGNGFRSTPIRVAHRFSDGEGELRKDSSPHR